MSDEFEAEPHLRHLGRSPSGDGDEVHRTVAVGRVGSRAQLTVRFVRQDGTEDGFSYSHLHHLWFDGGTRIELEFYSHTVTVEGRGLDRLVRYLCDHKASVVREADGGGGRPGLRGGRGRAGEQYQSGPNVGRVMVRIE